MGTALDLRWGRLFPLSTFCREKFMWEVARAPAELPPSKPGWNLRGSLLNLPKTSSPLDVIASEATGLGRGSLLNLPMASSLLDLSAVAASSILARGSWLILSKASSLLDLVIVSRGASFVSFVVAYWWLLALSRECERVFDIFTVSVCLTSELEPRGTMGKARSTNFELDIYI